MGSASSVLQEEIARPADGSDIAASVDAARAEVVRLRALLRAQAEAAGVEDGASASTGPTGEGEEEDATAEVWAYVGTAKNAAGSLFGDYNFRRVLFDRGTDGQPPSVTMDMEYTPASEGSVGGYRCRYKMDWDVATGHVGTAGESWQGTLTGGGVPGAPMDFRNKWNNILDFQPVRKLPASALLDEDNPPAPALPLTEEQKAAGAAVEKLPSPECWVDALWFMETPILTRKQEHELGAEAHAARRAQAFAWLFAALDVDGPSEELVALMKRLLQARRFTALLEPAQFQELSGLCARELDRIGATLAAYYDAEGLHSALGQLGASVWPDALPKRPRQNDVIPTPPGYFPNTRADSSTVSMSEYVYISILVLIGLGINDEFQQRAAEAVHRAVPEAVYSGAPVKGFHRMYNKLWHDHRDAGAPRPGRNIDVVRSYASVATADQLVGVFDELKKEFGNVEGVRLCKNNFTDTDASDVAHYRAVYAIVDFAPKEPMTFGQLAARSAERWEEYINSRDPLEQGGVRRAVGRLTGALANAPVRMLCEVQLLLHTYLRTRGAMHLLYKVKRADNAEALWRDFSGRVHATADEVTTTQ